MGKGISAFVLVSILLFPLAIRFSHLWEHEHHTYVLGGDDFHEEGHECLACHLQLASFTYDVPIFSGLSSPIYPKTAEKHFVCCPAFHSFSQTNTRLRAPPLFL